MNELSRNLLSSAREGMSPDAAAMARVRAKVAASVAAAGAGSVAAVPTKASAGVGVKLAIGALAIAAVTVAVVMVRARSPRVESPHVAVAPLEADEPASAIHMASPESQVAAGPASTPAVIAPRTPIASTSAAITPAANAPAATAEPVSLAREVELVDKAMLLVRRGDARDAIAVIATFDRETRGQGQMAEDAAAIDIEARCQLREDVTARLAAFDRAWPSSAQRSRLQTACFSR